MNSQLRHPEDDQLMRYADGELPARQARKIQAHLQACWQCRTELEELQNTVGECVRYRKNVLKECLPAPPVRWDDLTGGFDEIDASLRRRSRLAVLAQTKTWLPIAASLLLGAGIYYQFRHTPPVQAAELLRKAVAAAEAAPSAPHRIRIRTSRQTVVRTAGLKSASPDPAEAMLPAAHYSAEDPLSARSFAQWREQLTEKQDRVTTADDRYQIRTSTPVGELAVATLDLRTSDLHPVYERLEFRNQDWIEIEELGVEVPAPAAVASADASTPAAPPAPAAPERPTNSEFRQPAPAATVGDELQVLVALHNLGADLGEHIEVKRAEGQVLVAGLGIDTQRREQIERALGTTPNVVVRFSEGADGATQPERPVRNENASGADAAALQARIEKQVGGRANYERLSAELLDASETMMARAFALRRLAEQFPREVEPEMTAADRRTLRELYRAHAAALGEQSAAIARILRPVLVPLGGIGGAAPVARSGDWQSDTRTLFRTARRAESLLAVMLGVAPGETVNLPSQVLSSLAQLRTSAEAYGPAGLAPDQR